MRAAMLRGFLDRAYAGRLPRAAIEEAVAARASAGRGGGSGAGTAAAAAAVSSAAQPAEAEATMTWAAAVDAFGGRAALRAGLEVPLVSPADAEYLVLPPAPVGAGARGRHIPLLQRATGKGVEQRWRELSDAQRAEISQQHPVNAPRLAAEAAGRDAVGAAGAGGAPIATRIVDESL